jgi:hypothetical protein
VRDAQLRSSGLNIVGGGVGSCDVVLPPLRSILSTVPQLSNLSEGTRNAT